MRIDAGMGREFGRRPAFHASRPRATRRPHQCTKATMVARVMHDVEGGLAEPMGRARECNARLGALLCAACRRAQCRHAAHHGWCTHRVVGCSLVRRPHPRPGAQGGGGGVEVNGPATVRQGRQPPRVSRSTFDCAPSPPPSLPLNHRLTPYPAHGARHGRGHTQPRHRDTAQRRLPPPPPYPPPPALPPPPPPPPPPYPGGGPPWGA
jgi:hypothetical protein